MNTAAIMSPTLHKQLLLECLLQDPQYAWLNSLDSRQAMRFSILLYLGKPLV